MIHLFHYLLGKMEGRIVVEFKFVHLGTPKEGEKKAQ